MEATTEIKPGYKKTKLGWIPEEWEVSTLSDLCDFSTGKNIKQREASPNYKIPCVRYGELYHLYTEVINEVINKTNLDRSQLKFSLGNEILLPSAGEDPLDIGSASALIIKNVAIGRTINILRPKKDNLYSQIFLSYYINQKLRKKIASLAKGVSISNVYNSDLKQLKLVLPPLPEQKKIADILSTWDKAIETTQALIKKLQLRKKGLMQQLLTGEKRLPGFSGEWEETRIGKVADEYSVKNKADKKIEVLSCTKYDGLVPSLQYFGRKVFGDDLSKYKIVPKEYFAYATNHIEEGSIGFQDLMDFGLVSPMYTVFKTTDVIDDTFFFKLLKTNKMIYQYQSNMSGSIARRGGLRWDVFKSIGIILPEKEEQIAIAKVLTKADEEVNQMQNYLNHLQEQKRGLMQQLLTGQKRVVV